MPIDLDINQGTVIKLPTGLYRFVEERPHRILALKREGTGFELPMPEHKLKLLLGEGKAELIDFIASGEDEKPGPNDNAEFGPDEEWADDEDDVGDKKEGEPKKLSPEVRRARALQFYARKWDEDGRDIFGEKGLQNLIDLWRPVAIQKGYEPKDIEGFRVKPAQLKRAIKRCGARGDRPLRVFRSRRGKNKRKRFCDFVEQALNDAVEFYWKTRECNYTYAYAHFHGLIGAENKKRKGTGLPTLEFPERPEVLRRRITAATNYANWARKYSKYEAHRKFKGTKDHLMAERPLELVIMDHTRLDIWVLDSELNLPLGRPWLTIAIDVATRMVLGYLISFEPASLYSVLATLKRVNKNKTYVKRTFPDINGAWDGWGRPMSILVDRGWEFTSPSFQDALQDLGTDIIWAPVRTPQYKAIGERFFGTLNTMLWHRMPGGVPYPAHVMRQVRLDPKSGAVMTLSDLDELMHQAIIEVHQYETHSGLEAAPAKVWQDKIKQHRRPFIRDIKALNSLLGRVDTATLKTSGITFRNMQFHEHTLTEMLLDDLIKHEAKRSQSDKTFSSGTAKVKIKWDPIDASSIEVWNHGGTPKPHYVTLRNVDDKFKGLSFWHVEKIREFCEQENLNFHDKKQRWEARDRLQKKWMAFSAKLPMRETRDERRGLAYSQGTFDGKNTNDDNDIGPSNIHYAVAEPSRSGKSKAPPLVPDEIPASERMDEGEQQKGREQPEKVKKKIKAKKARNKAEAEEQEIAAAEQERANLASGESVVGKGRPNGKTFTGDSLPRGEGWGDET
jgi:putative transposase